NHQPARSRSGVRSRLHPQPGAGRPDRRRALQLPRLRLEEQRHRHRTGVATTKSMLDVLIVGAGPAGTVAATVLARQGARVRIVDRARFPRDKLCGDTVNPGTLALLRRLGMADRIEARGLPVDGMIVSGGDGVVVRGAYPEGLQGRAIVRRE